MEFQKKDGSFAWVEVNLSLLRGVNEKVTGILGVARDITERKQMENALREREEKFRLMSENIPVAVYSALPDEHSTNLFISGRMKELTGYTTDQFMNDPNLWSEIIYPNDRHFVWKSYAEVCVGRQFRKE